MNYSDIAWIILAFLFGGALKGTIGVGAPVVVVPILTIFFDIQTAVMTMVIPNLVTNLWQTYQYRQFIKSIRFVIKFALSGAIGAAIGTTLLISLSPAPLLLGLSSVIFMFVFFRIQKPNSIMSETVTRLLVIPCGLIGGVLQGSAGVSAPVSVTFLNLMKLKRNNFIPIISIYFVSMSLIQIPLLSSTGALTPAYVLYSGLAVPIIFLGMIIGHITSRYISEKAFEKIIIWILFLMAIKLTHRALTGQ
jgi:uncharacterized membrane protein YfcA